MQRFLLKPLPEIFNGLDFIVAIKEELCVFEPPAVRAPINSLLLLYAKGCDISIPLSREKL